MGIKYRLWEFLFAGLWGLFLLYCTGEVMYVVTGVFIWGFTGVK